MMKKILIYIFISIFFAMCVFFSLGLVLKDASADDVAPPPKLVIYGKINSKIGGEFEEWFSKNFAFSKDLTDIYADIKLKLFDEGNDQVVAGRDGFLFFSDTVPDFVGSELLTDGEIDEIADALSELASALDSSGTKLLFICAPNKNSIYPEKMPSNYIYNGESRDIDRLYTALSKRGVEYIDLRDVLAVAKETTLIYHKRDTHWNGEGARIATEAALLSLGVTPVDLSAREKTTVYDFDGDLDALLYPKKKLYDENVVYDFAGLYVYTSAFSTAMDMVITTRGGGEGRLLMYRDSFGSAMLPYLASSFRESKLLRGTPYDISEIERYSPDYVIIEIAERNIRELMLYLSSDEADNG